MVSPSLTSIFLINAMPPLHSSMAPYKKKTASKGLTPTITLNNPSEPFNPFHQTYECAAKYTTKTENISP